MHVGVRPHDRDRCVGSSGDVLKRFTDTNKWRDPWFRCLSCPAKQLWCYLLDHCDAIGLVEINFRLISDDCGQPIEEKHLTELGDRLQSVNSGRYFIPKFIFFQYGNLTPACPPHRKIIALVASHGLVKRGDQFRYPNVTLSESTTGKTNITLSENQATHPRGIVTPQAAEEDKEKEKEGDCKGGSWIGKESEDQWQIAKRWLADWTKNGADYTEFEARGAFLALQAGGWQWGKRDITDPRAALERQIQTDRERKANGHSKTYRPNPRLEGVSRNNAVNNYGEAAKRKLERQALEAANREAPKAEGT